MLNLEIVPVGVSPPAGNGTMTPEEIEAAYNARVAIMTQAEAEAGVSTVVRRVHALRLKQAVLAHAPVGGGGGMTSAEVEAAYNAQVPIITQAGGRGGRLDGGAADHLGAHQAGDPGAGPDCLPLRRSSSRSRTTARPATAPPTTRPPSRPRSTPRAPAGGGTVIFPAGTYRIAATLTFRATRPWRSSAARP